MNIGLYLIIFIDDLLSLLNNDLETANFIDQEKCFTEYLLKFHM